jgi:anti-anti-sigma factor
MDTKMIEMTKNGDFYILDIKVEELDFIKTPKFSEEMRDKLDETQYPSIILNLENLYYIDSTGLSSLINISRKIQEHNSEKEMVVVCNSPKIIQIFNIAKISNFFRIFGNLSDAEHYLSLKPRP